jgi:hypothetical protein
MRGKIVFSRFPSISRVQGLKFRNTIKIRDKNPIPTRVGLAHTRLDLTTGNRSLAKVLSVIKPVKT